MTPLDASQYRCLDRPLEPADERGAAAGSAAEREDTAREALAARPFDPEVWAELGRLGWEQVIRTGSAAARQEAEQAFDLARMLSWPWFGDPPYVAEERMHRARLGQPVALRWPARPTPEAVRGGVLAFLAETTPPAAWVTAFYETAERAVPGQRPSERFWIAMAVCERLGDLEQRARFAERLLHDAPPIPWPGLRPLLTDARRKSVALAYGGLRQSVLADRSSGAALTALAEPVLQDALPRLHGPDLPLAIGQAGLPAIDAASRGSDAPRVATLLEIGLAHRESGGAALLQACHDRAAAWPGPARALVGLATDEAAGPFAVRMLLERVAKLSPRTRAGWLVAGCRLLCWQPDEARTASLERLLEAAEQWPAGRRTERLPVTLAAMAALRGLKPESQGRLLDRARRGWTSAAEHDAVGLAAVTSLLASAGERQPGALDQARFLATRIDGSAERVTALLQVAAALGPEAPEEAARLASAGLRRVRRQVTDPARQVALQLEAARLMAGAGEADGVAVLLSWSRRARVIGRRGRPGPAELVRALAERGPSEPLAWSTAEALTAALRGVDGWLARLHLAACGPVSEQATRLNEAVAAEPGGLARRPAASLLATLVAEGQPHAASWPALLDALPAAGSIRTLAKTDGAAMVSAVAKIGCTAELDPVVSWATHQARPAARWLGWALVGEGLQTLVARRAAEQAAAVTEQLAACYASQLARAAGGVEGRDR